MNHPNSGYCNPLNLSYRFQVQGWAEQAVREAADPSIVSFQGEYWLFASKSSGYWHSTDMRDWQYIDSQVLPAEDYAPDVRVINGALHFTASHPDNPCPVFRTTNPKADEWELVGSHLVYWDPNMFQDDDGRTYLYWGCTNSKPIYGVEVDPATMAPIGEILPIIDQDVENRGWERFGENGGTGERPYFEGAWMTKHQGRYYLQYAAPGTEWNTYGDGVFVGEAPLGPYTYATHNPFSFKPGGFIQGAGHGSTFWDVHGNLWHAATMRISVKHNFERRLGIFPAGFDADGVLYCNTRFGDYPTRLPQGTWDAWQDASPGWMLLSYRKPVTASSALPSYPVEQAVDEDIRTYWAAETGDAGEWLQVDLGGERTIHAVQINFAEHECNQFGRAGEKLYHQYLLEASTDGQVWSTACDKRENQVDVPHDYLEFPQPLTTRYLRLTLHHMPALGHVAVSGFRVFGLANGEKPAPVRDLTAQLLADDARTADVNWQAQPGVTGYNVLWGISPEKLYNSWMVLEAAELKLTALTIGTSYWLRVDAFNESGVTEGAVVPIQPASESSTIV